MIFDDTTNELTSALQTAAAKLLEHLASETLIIPLASAGAAYIVIGDNLALQRLCRAIVLDPPLRTATVPPH